MFSTVPIMAVAPLTRPVRFRQFRSSTVNTWYIRSQSDSGQRSTARRNALSATEAMFELAVTHDQMAQPEREALLETWGKISPQAYWLTGQEYLDMGDVAMAITAFRIGDISETAGCVCGLAKVMRRELRKRKIEKQPVLFSTEEAKKCALDSENGRHAPGSISFVPPAAGYLLASKCVRDIIFAD